MTVPAKGFPGGRTLKTPFTFLLTREIKKKIVRVNDVGPGVEDIHQIICWKLVSAKIRDFGTGEGFKLTLQRNANLVQSQDP
ncbi:MAG: hypothetical protein CM15mV24_0380 [Bellamyvirus sp.]|nr:MAG: hypothetical protein CM15mV24_0380 [Bellamyvirus sp.]